MHERGPRSFVNVVKATHRKTGLGLEKYCFGFLWLPVVININHRIDRQIIDITQLIISFQNVYLTTKLYLSSYFYISVHVIVRTVIHVAAVSRGGFRNRRKLENPTITKLCVVRLGTNGY